MAKIRIPTGLPERAIRRDQPVGGGEISQLTSPTRAVGGFAGGVGQVAGAFAEQLGRERLAIDKVESDSQFSAFQANLQGQFDAYNAERLNSPQSPDADLQIFDATAESWKEIVGNIPNSAARQRAQGELIDSITRWRGDAALSAARQKVANEQRIDRLTYDSLVSSIGANPTEDSVAERMAKMGKHNQQRVANNKISQEEADILNETGRQDLLSLWTIDQAIKAGALGLYEDGVGVINDAAKAGLADPTDARRSYDSWFNQTTRNAAKVEAVKAQRALGLLNTGESSPQNIRELNFSDPLAEERVLEAQHTENQRRIEGKPPVETHSPTFNAMFDDLIAMFETREDPEIAQQDFTLSIFANRYEDFTLSNDDAKTYSDLLGKPQSIDIITALKDARDFGRQRFTTSLPEGPLLRVGAGGQISDEPSIAEYNRNLLNILTKERDKPLTPEDVLRESRLFGVTQRPVRDEITDIAATRTVQATARPTTQEEVDALPKGQSFLWTDGNIYIKD